MSFLLVFFNVGPFRPVSSVAVLPAASKLEAVKTTFLLGPNTTFSLCCHKFSLILSTNNNKKRSDMQIQQTERSFRYSGLVLPDPDPSLGIEAVRSVYASSYPEITTAAVSGPELVDGKYVYTFKAAVGTKA
jgi:PRTRC genetic system protein C